MTLGDLIELRKILGLSQAEMGELAGMSMRAYQDIEYGKSTFRPVHLRAIERGALALAVERKNPMLAPASVRKQALELARMITEG